MKEELKDRFIGPNKVVGAVIEDYKTPEGDEVVRVMYENTDLAHGIFPKKVFERLVSEKPIDYTTFREVRYVPVLQKLAAVLVEENVAYEDLNYVCKELGNKLLDSFERASSYLWTKNDRLWISGVPFLTEKTVLQADQILRTIKSDDGTTGTTENAEGNQ